MKIMKKEQLLFCVQIAVLGAIAPVCAMPDFDGWEWKSDKEYTDAEWQEMFQAKNIRGIWSSAPSKTVEDFKKKMGLQENPAPAASSASSSQAAHSASAEKAGEPAGTQREDDTPKEDNAQREGDTQKKEADKEYEALIHAAGLKEIDPSSQVALRFKARFSLQNSKPSDSDSNSDTDSKDGDLSGELAYRPAQLDTQKKLFTDQKNKNCCSRLWACLNRMFAAGLPAKKRGPAPAPTLGSLLDKLWD